MKKNEKYYNLLIGGCIAGIVATIVISLVVGKAFENERNKKDEIVRAENDATKQVQIEKEELEKKEKREVVERNLENLNDNEAKIKYNRSEVEFNSALAKFELTSDTAFTLERQVRELYRNFQFAEASEKLQEISDKYKFTDKEVSKNLEILILESSRLLHMEAYEDTANPQIKTNLIKGISDMENKMISVLSVSSNERDGLIHDRDSINPEFSGNIKILAVSELDEANDIFIRAKLSDDTLKKIHVYEIEIEGNKLIAYMGEATDRNYFYRLEEEVEDSTDYLTISEWQEIKEEHGL